MTRPDHGKAPRQEQIFAGGTALVLAYLSLVPVIYLLWGTFSSVDGWSLSAFRGAFGSTGWFRVARDSFVFAGGSTLLAVAVGTVLAYLVARTNVYFKGAMFAASLLPLVVPGVLHTIAWIFLAGPRAGLLNRLSSTVGAGTPFDIFNPWGMIFVEGLHLAPIAFLFMFAAFRTIDPSLEEAALISGARLSSVFARVTFPVVRPALAASGIVIGIRALEAFEVPTLIGLPARVVTFTSSIWQAIAGRGEGLGAAGAHGTILVALTGGGLLLYLFLNRRGWAPVAGRSRRSDARPLDLGRWRKPATALLLVYLLLSVVLPVAVLSYASLQPSYSGELSLTGLSLDNYAEVLSNERVGKALLNSLVLSVSAATIVVLFSGFLAWLTVKTEVRGRGLLEMMAFLPLGVPGIVLGVALLFIYLRSPIPIFGTLWLLLLSYITRYIPYGIRYAGAAMQGVPNELQDAAHVSGAHWWPTLRRVLLPAIIPGLAAGWIYIFIVSIRELASSIILYSPGTEVTSVIVWQMWQNGRFTEVAAFGMMMTGALALVTAVGRRFWDRVGLRTG